MRVLFRLALVSLVFSTVACTTTRVDSHKPVSVRTIPVVVTANPQQTQAATPSSPVVGPASRQVLPAVENMIQQCRSSLSANRWQEAIANAERGLRMDRREPHFYWVLAVAYQQLGNIKQAKHFATQGLRYVEDDKALEGELKKFRDL